MAEERIFPDENVATKAEDYHGTVRFERVLPDLAGQGVKSANLEISFEEALEASPWRFSPVWSNSTATIGAPSPAAKWACSWQSIRYTLPSL